MVSVLEAVSYCEELNRNSAVALLRKSCEWCLLLKNLLQIKQQLRFKIRQDIRVLTNCVVMIKLFISYKSSPKQAMKPWEFTLVCLASYLLHVRP